MPDFAPGCRRRPRRAARRALGALDGDDPKSALTVDHGVWAGVADAHLRIGADGINRVDYGLYAAEGRAAQLLSRALRRLPVGG